MYNMQWAKVNRLAKKLNFFPKKHPQNDPRIMNTFWDILTLEGARRQTVDTRLTFTPEKFVV